MPNVKKPARVSTAKHHTQIENISVLGVTERMGPPALHTYAESFLKAACLLPEPTPTVPFDPVRPYLVCHAIELGLKAFLSLNGVLMPKLADSLYGHNLDKILDQAVETGINDKVKLAETHCDAIRLASAYYSGKVFEYPAVGEAISAYPHMPPIETLFDAASILVETLAQPCREAK